MIFNETATNASLLLTHQQSLAYKSCLGILASFGVLFNGLLLFILWRNKTTEFRSATSFVIGNLALADCLTGIAVILFVVQYDYAPIAHFQLSMVWTTIEASLLSLMVLSIERTIAFSHPFTTSSIVTVKRTIFVLVLTWIISITCGICVYFYTVPTQFGLTVVFEVSVFVFIIGQGFIFFKMRQRNNEMLIRNREISRGTRKAMRQTTNNHVTKVVLILVFVVVVTVLPYMIGLQIIYWTLLGYKPGASAEIFDGVATFIHYFYPIELINFAVNPIIYAWRLKRYRRALFVAFPILKRHRNLRRESMTACSRLSRDQQNSMKECSASYRKSQGVRFERAQPCLTSDAE